MGRVTSNYSYRGKGKREGGGRTRESNLPGDERDVLAAETETVGGDRLALVLATTSAGSSGGWLFLSQPLVVSQRRKQWAETVGGVRNRLHALPFNHYGTTVTLPNWWK